MAVTSIDIDPEELRIAKHLVGASSNRETVDIALKTLIALRRQPDAVERIIARQFDDDQVHAPKQGYPVPGPQPSGDLVERFSAGLPEPPPVTTTAFGRRPGAAHG